jgi:hypothetical protein
MAPYQYLPLFDDEIRLLTLSPRYSGSPRIRIDSQRLFSTHRPQYEALSYVWGSHENPSEITIKHIDKNKNSKHTLKSTTPGPGTSNSSHHIRPSLKSRSGALFQQAAQKFRSKVSLSITANLAQALPYLQLEEEERVLWIDAICIDQENLTERGQQVGRMADIYKLADRVVIWLGPQDRHTELALQTVVRLAAEVDVNFATGEVSERSEGPMSLPSYDRTATESLISLFQRPWFERLWIWQEVHARPENAIVLMGDCRIMWKTIRKFLVRFMSEYKIISVHAELLQLLQQAVKLSQSIGTRNLTMLLDATTHCKCADDRDRVFALLGMLDPSERLNIEPDYAKSAADVFKQVVVNKLAHSARLDDLRHCDLMHKSDGMPSWVPRWSRIYKEDGASRASSNIAAKAIYNGGDTLRVTGVGLGNVSSIQASGLSENTNSKGGNWSSFVSSFFSLLPAVETSDDLDPTMDLMMRNLCWNYFVYDTQEPIVSFSLTEVKESLLRWREYLAKERRYQDVCKPPPISRGDLHFRARVLDLQSEYSLFRTTKGHLGLGPRLAVQGDRVCVVRGCNQPLVLRLLAVNQWSIVGDCYVHDVADGSALLSSLPDNFQYIEQMNRCTGMLCAAFRNMQTNDVQIQDPRVTEPLPADWEVMEHEDDSYIQIFGNKEQKRITDSDPRLTPDALRAQGVKLKTFNLV